MTFEMKGDHKIFYLPNLVDISSWWSLSFRIYSAKLCCSWEVTLIYNCDYDCDDNQRSKITYKMQNEIKDYSNDQVVNWLPKFNVLWEPISLTYFKVKFGRVLILSIVWSSRSYIWKKQSRQKNSFSWSKNY